jgi:predicted dehydrogenase
MHAEIPTGKDRRENRMRDIDSMTRPQFLATLAGGAATAAAAAPRRKRVALAGTGHRGSGTWGRDLVGGYGDFVEMVGLCDTNSKRAEVARKMIGVNAPVFTDFDKMLAQTRPEMLIVTTRDAVHHEQIVRGLEFGCEVLTEKPMTNDAGKCQQILDAEKNTGGKLTVAFDYRYSPTARKMKELLMNGAIGEVSSVDFHWDPDIRHGADYFRRWHALRRWSNTLFPHKSTHHFDLVNWYLDAEPVEVFAMADLREYGSNGKFRGENCRGCAHRKQCAYYWDIMKDARLKALYVDCESEDGYFRDGCVYRESIDIFDTMTAQVRYTNRALMSYSVHTFMPIEGHHLAFNGSKGRVELRRYERQAWSVPPVDEIRLSRNFGASEIIVVEQGQGGHFGGDPALKELLFHPERPDTYKQRAGARAGAMSLLTGVAAVRSVERRQPVRIDSLVRL